MYIPKFYERPDKGDVTFRCIQNPQTQMNVAGFMVCNTNGTREQGVVRVYVPNHIILWKRKPDRTEYKCFCV